MTHAHDFNFPLYKMLRNSYHCDPEEPDSLQERGTRAGESEKQQSMVHPPRNVFPLGAYSTFAHFCREPAGSCS